MLNEQDLQLLNSKGISEEKLNSQLNSFVKGFPFLKLYAAASVNHGISVLSDKDQKKYLDVWENYLRSDHKVVKFVPASGAASRMFKDLFEFLSVILDAENGVVVHDTIGQTGAKHLFFRHFEYLVLEGAAAGINGDDFVHTLDISSFLVVS